MKRTQNGISYFCCLIVQILFTLIRFEYVDESLHGRVFYEFKLLASIGNTDLLCYNCFLRDIPVLYYEYVYCNEN